MTHLKFVALACFLCAAACTEGSDTGSTDFALGHHLTCPASKVLICHMPPGNPTNVQEICVGPAAVKAHVANHGDNLGACNATCEPGGGCDADSDCCRGEACDVFNGECVSVVPGV